ncbi:putative tyrosinase-like protein tyr-3 [Bulinus truncatus]|nr:putative tyrosinase-like protein tyr-3 [Bulinus truncatus]
MFLLIKEKHYILYNDLINTMSVGMRISVALFCLVLLSILQITDQKIVEIAIPAQLQECYNRVKQVKVDSYIGSIYSWFCEHAIMNYSLPSFNKSLENEYINKLYETALEDTKTNSRKKRQATERCVRQEYRMLTLDERRRYHNAINALKRDTSVYPNKYEAIANIHTGEINRIAHGGAGFLGWHRIYLLIYETALREVDPSICLPYWDTTLDYDLYNPYMSSIWSEEFLGTPRGAVVRGPFAYWTYQSGGQLIRNAGVDGDLLSQSEIRNVLSRRRYEDIVASRTTDPMYDIEQLHGTVHVYIGGAMSRLNTAPNDPAFFLLHCFVDYIFQMFRDQLRASGADPAKYPTVVGNPRHMASATTGFTNYTQADGYSESLASQVSYKPVPTCSANDTSCGNRYLFCDLSTGRCLPSIRTLTRLKRSINTSSASESCDSETPYGQPVQNDYCIDGNCDTNQWAIIPVKLVSTRPPKLQHYNSYPVRAGHLDYRRDIYSPAAYAHTNRYIRRQQGNQKTYSRCDQETLAGQIFVYSRGIDYVGFYKESSIVDHKLTASVSMGFVGVKRPRPGGVSKALIRAHDSCGRVCQVTCRDPNTDEFKVCSGAIAVTNDKPLMFGKNFDEAVMSVFDYSFNNQCPKFRSDHFYFIFYCFYSNTYPYAN